MTKKSFHIALLFLAIIFLPLAAVQAQFIVDSPADSGPGTLREAINFANTTPNTTITFAIPGVGVQIITLSTDLPDIFGNGTVINGYSQPGSAPNTLSVGSNAIIGIEITGSTVRCLNITGDNVTVRGLSLYNNTNTAILVVGNSAAVEGCFIGMRADGTGGGSIVQTYGINLTSSGIGARIGGSLPAQRNVISGNSDGSDGRGIVVQRDNVFIAGNIIGPAPNGVSAVVIAFVQPFGILVEGGSNLRIGGALAGEGNVISANGDGIVIGSYSQPVIAPRIQGNFIGLTAQGDQAAEQLSRAIQGYGILSELSTVQIGGKGAGEGNVISGNTRGIRIESDLAGTVSAVIEGNIIGPQKDGVSPVTNAAQLIGIWAYADGFGQIAGLTIGSDTPGGKNILAFHTECGIQFEQGSGKRIIDTRLLINSIYGNAVGINIVSFLFVTPPRVIDDASPTLIFGSATPNDTVRIYTGKDTQGQFYLGTTVAEATGNWSLSGNFPLSDFVTMLVQDDELPNFSNAFAVVSGGPAWTNSNAGIAPGALLTVVSTPSLVIASSENGNIYLSQTGGQSWTAVPPLPIAPADTLYGLSLPRGAALGKSNRAASANGFGSAVAVGVGGTILRSNDASAWSLVSSGTSASLYGVAVSPDFSTLAAKDNSMLSAKGFGSAVAVGVGGTILRSVDGGSNWQSISSGTTSTLLSVAVSSNFSGVAGKSSSTSSAAGTQGFGSAVAVGVGGTILRSADGGTIWQSISSNVSTALNSISLSPEFATLAAKGNGTQGTLGTAGFGSAVAVGVGGTILRSADGGSSWSNVSGSVTNLGNITAPLTTDLLSVELVSETLGYACGKGGVILQTTDGGLSWRQQPSGTTADINDIAVLANGSGNAVGSGTTALITNNGGNPVLSVGTSGASLPQGFALRQNYPNPFNPNTMIRYQLPVGSIVKLNVYDVLGREVASLVDTQQAAGDYVMSFNAAKLSSGVYFYRLSTRSSGSQSGSQAGSFVQTKKMLLLK